MKKITGLLLAMIFLFVFSGCSAEKDLTSEFDALIKLDESNYTKTSSQDGVSSYGETPIRVELPSKIEYSSDVETPIYVEMPSKIETYVETELNDYHNVVQAKSSTPDVPTSFEPIIDNNFSGGNGTQTNPYLITTPEHLTYLSSKINSGKLNDGAYFALGADIDMTGVEFTPIGNGDNRFSSNFDGRGFTVSNLSPKLLYDDYGNNANCSCGFFGIVGNAEIKNLCLENVNITYTYDSNYFTEIGILAGCVYPTRECKITDCIVNGNINVSTDVLLVGGIIGDIFANDDAKLEFARIQSNTKIQVRGDSLEVGAISGSLLADGEESFSDIFAQSEILHNSMYYSHVGAFGGVSNRKGNVNVSNCFIKINTNKKHGDKINALIGGMIETYQPNGRFNFTNVFAFADSCTKLYDIPSENPVKEENCGFTDVLPSTCNFNTEIWDITDPASPFIKFNF